MPQPLFPAVPNPDQLVALYLNAQIAYRPPQSDATGGWAHKSALMALNALACVPSTSPERRNVLEGAGSLILRVLEDTHFDLKPGSALDQLWPVIGPVAVELADRAHVAARDYRNATRCAPFVPQDIARRIRSQRENWVGQYLHQKLTRSDFRARWLASLKEEEAHRPTLSSRLRTPSSGKPPSANRVLMASSGRQRAQISD